MYILWGGFLITIILLLALDLGVFHRKIHVIKAKEAILWTIFWIILSLIFNIFIYYLYKFNWYGIGTAGHDIVSGKDAALKYFTGYIIEKSLSLDNIFVIAIIFTYFKVPALYQHRVLFWGIMGALVMRGIMIVLGAALIQKFSWMIYVFGAFLIITAVKMLVTGHDTIHPEKNVLVRIARKIYPMTNDFSGSKFFIKINNKRIMTPLFLVLLIIESMDVLFAVDSIPAIFAVTTDPFIVFTSNIFAILGLRSLYFALAALMGKFRYLKISLVFILAYVGVKMILSHSYPIPTVVSLCVIATILFIGVYASIFENRYKNRKSTSGL
jgi:tellurite resistance protein TerC